MPTYDYRCEECNYTFEFWQKITDDPLKECPRCSGKVRRLIGGGVGLIFKGSGFYVTDYKKNNSNSLSRGSSNNNKSNEKSKATKKIEKGDE